MAAANVLVTGQTRPGVFVTDETLLDQDDWQLQDAAFKYIRTGGTIVIATISCETTYIEEFVVKLGVPWTGRNHERRVFTANPAFRHFDVSGIPENKLKALYFLYLTDVADEDSLLICPRNIPVSDFYPQIMYSAMIGEGERRREASEVADLKGNYAAGAITKIGQGRVRYVAECFGRPET